MSEPFLNKQKKEMDLPLLASTAALAAGGVIFIFSASGEASQDQPLYLQKFFLQIVWCVVGTGAAVALCMVDYNRVARWANVGYWAAMLLLLSVLVVGVAHYGGRRWINLGAFSLQPSEVAKIAFIFLMGQFLSRPAEELRQPKVFFAALGYTALPFVLIKMEPDLGSALTFLSVSFVMMFVAGVPGRFLGFLTAGAGMVVVVLVAIVLFVPDSNSIKSYQKDRLLTYFGDDLAMRNVPPAERKIREKELRDNSYNVEQAEISVGSGGLIGKGWRQGTQHALGFLPKAGAHNDFIFSVIAEEEGFVGSVVILALYSVLLFSGIKIAGQARDRLGQLLAIGVVTLLFTHVFINIGMNIRLMPVTGIPLPLVSYGGSSVVCSLIAIGILHNVHIYRRSY